MERACCSAYSHSLQDGDQFTKFLAEQYSSEAALPENHYRRADKKSRKEKRAWRGHKRAGTRIEIDVKVIVHSVGAVIGTGIGSFNQGLWLSRLGLRTNLHLIDRK